LRRIIGELRRTLAEPSAGLGLLASARKRIDALTDAEPDQLEAAKLAMRSTKAVVRADIARFERDQSTRPASVVTEWLTSLLRRYEAWLARLSPP
jgi:class 3 adenylate cyclase